MVISHARGTSGCVECGKQEADCGECGPECGDACNPRITGCKEGWHRPQMFAVLFMQFKKKCETTKESGICGRNVMKALKQSTRKWQLMCYATLKARLTSCTERVPLLCVK